MAELIQKIKLVNNGKNMQKEMMLTFLKRAVSSILLIAAFTTGVLYLIPKYFTLTIIFFLTITLYEFYEMIDKNNRKILSLIGIISGILILFGHYLPLEYKYSIIEFTPIVLFLSLLGIFMAYIFEKHPIENALESISLSFIGLFFITWLGGHIIPLRYLFNGQYLILLVIAIVKSGDIGAYIIGTKFGTHKIMPVLSPKKSIQGCIGGFLTSIIVGILLYKVFTHFNIKLYSLIEIIILSGIINLLGQFGDMAESLIKRQFNTKDSGNIIPGIGGLLDLIDSLIFTIPFLYYYEKLRYLL